MEDEKIVIKSSSIWAKKLKRLVIVLLIASITITLLSVVLVYSFDDRANKLYEAHHNSHIEYDESQIKYDEVLDRYYTTNNDWKDYEDKYYSLLNTSYFFGATAKIGLVLLSLSVVLLVIFLYSSKMEITVTNKRVYGKTAFGKRVDLPLDSISAIGQSAFKGLAVATSAGKIKFVGIENRDDIHREITHLLTQRQGKPVATTQIRQEIPQSNADELKKYKDLLDSGIISQEEFDAKKKQLLGL